MPTDSKFKKLVRARMEQTGETYTQARNALKAEAPTPVEAPVAEPTTRDRIRAVLAEYPLLCDEGFLNHELFLPSMREHLDFNPDEALAASREMLLSEEGVRRVELCMDFLKPLPKLRHAAIYRARTACPSGYLVKAVDGWACSTASPITKVSSGAAIVAAILEGFSIHRRRNSRLPDCNLSVSYWSVHGRVEQAGKLASERYYKNLERVWSGLVYVIHDIFKACEETPPPEHAAFAST
jgi:hypothetical protein